MTPIVTSKELLTQLVDIDILTFCFFFSLVEQFPFIDFSSLVSKDSAIIDMETIRSDLVMYIQ